jgi:hypothetical protein
MRLNLARKIILSLVTLLLSSLALSINLEAERLMDNLANQRFDKLGHPQIKTDSIKPVLATVQRPHRLLVISVEFTDLSYDRFAGDRNQEKRIASICKSCCSTALSKGPLSLPCPTTSATNPRDNIMSPARFCLQCGWKSRCPIMVAHCKTVMAVGVTMP